MDVVTKGPVRVHIRAELVGPEFVLRRLGWRNLRTLQLLLIMLRAEVLLLRHNIPLTAMLLFFLYDLICILLLHMLTV